MRKELCCSYISSGVGHIMFGTLLQGILLILYFSGYIVCIFCYCCSCLLTSKYCFGYGIIPICFLEFQFLSVVYIVTKNEVLSATISMTLASITITLFVQVSMILAFHLGPLKVCYYSLNFILHVVYVHLAYLFLLVLWYSFLYADIIQLFFLGVCAYVYRFVLLVV